MFSLILAILCSAGVSVFMRASKDHCKSRYGLLLINYTACIISGLTTSPDMANNMSDVGMMYVMGFGILTGILYVAAFLLLQWNIEKNGVILSSTFMKLGVIVPTAIGVLWFGEQPGVTQYIGIFLSVAVILFLNLEKIPQTKEKRRRRVGGESVGGLLLLLLGGGVGDSMAKFYDTYGKAELSDLYLVLSFLISGLVCGVLVIQKKEKIGKSDVIYGCLIGIPNYFSARFLLDALADIPAFIAYPMYSIAAMVIIGVVGVFVFDERLTKRQWAVYAVVLVSVGLLNI